VDVIASELIEANGGITREQLRAALRLRPLRRCDGAPLLVPSRPPADLLA
jgi:hypothetical protein